MGRMADATGRSAGVSLVVMAGDTLRDATEIEDVLDRLEAWHRGAAPDRDATDDDASEVPARR